MIHIDNFFVYSNAGSEGIYLTSLSSDPFIMALCLSKISFKRLLDPITRPRTDLGLGTKLKGTGRVLPSSK